jgi:NAD(P)H-hydrate repair Nnr-like enzyme with NAD(P)H-hydrate dehydratase domain
VGRLTAARELATRLHCVVVLKGPGTVIASPHGSAWIDVEGTEVLGTAGSGDVLSGILAAVLAGAWARDPQSDLVMAVAAGVWLHGCAGRLATPPATALDIAMHVADAVAGVQAGVS